VGLVTVSEKSPILDVECRNYSEYARASSRAVLAAVASSTRNDQR
jgi:hypothetical protein